MKTYQPGVGMCITDAIRELLTEAKRWGESVEMHFNQIEVVASPNDDIADIASRWDLECSLRVQEYRSSVEGIAASAERHEQAINRKTAVDRLIHGWPSVAGTGWKNVLSWAEALTESADDIAVRFDKGKLASAMEAAGYAENFGVGKPRDWFNKPDNFGGYIMGQIINCLKSGMPPNPVAIKFIEDFRKEFPV